MKTIPLFIALLFGAASAYGQLISVDYKTAGDGLLTRDLNSGLEWLDLTLTINMSYNEVAAQLDSGGAFEGFRFATKGEFTALHESFGIPYATSSSKNGVPLHVQAAYDLQSLVGFTTIKGAPGPIPYTLLLSIGRLQPRAPGDHAGFRFPRGDIQILDWLPADVGDQYIATAFEFGLATATQRDPYTGSYLVRDAPSFTPVPEPSTYALFGVVCLGAAVIKRGRERRKVTPLRAGSAYNQGDDCSSAKGEPREPTRAR